MMIPKIFRRAPRVWFPALCFAAILIACGACSSESTVKKTETAVMPKTAVWIDTDPSISSGPREVDDGFALIQAFHSPELDIRGVSVVYGNAPFEQAWPISQEIVRKYGPPGLPIFAGATEAVDLGRETDATRALAAALEKEPLTILALGPVTNVATVLKNHPELGARITAIVAVAGRRPNQRFLTGAKPHRPFRDFNFERDAPGFQVLLDSSAPLVLAPWEISSKVWLREADLDRLAAGPPAAQWLVAPGRDWLAMWREKFDVDGFNPFDTLAVAYVTSPELIECEDLPAQIRQLPDDANSGATKPYLLAAKELAPARSVRYCHTPKPAFQPDLMARLLKP
jgi:inosine-uridine nucleoside N-ribohydrolase